MAPIRIAIRPPGWPYATVFAAFAIPGAVCYLAALSSSLIRGVIFATFIALFTLMRAVPTFRVQTVVLDGQALSICDRVFGIKLRPQKFFFNGVSNLRYEPRPLGEVNYQQGTIAFEYSSEPGVSHRFGSRLNEPEALRVIQLIDEYRSKAEASVR